MRRLAVLGLLGLRLAVLRIHRGIRHLSLGYDDRKLGEEGVCRDGCLLLARPLRPVVVTSNAEPRNYKASGGVEVQSILQGPLIRG